MKNSWMMIGLGGDFFSVMFYLPEVQILFRHALGFRQITPSYLPTFSKAAKTLSNCSSVWVAM